MAAAELSVATSRLFARAPPAADAKKNKKQYGLHILPPSTEAIRRILRNDLTEDRKKNKDSWREMNLFHGA